MNLLRWLALIVVFAVCVLSVSLPQSPLSAATAPSSEGAEALGRDGWDALNADQLSWVIEGIQERMSELESDLHYAQQLQAQKLNARPPG